VYFSKVKTNKILKVKALHPFLKKLGKKKFLLIQVALTTILQLSLMGFILGTSRLEG
jgi:hypothetical protein